MIIVGSWLALNFVAVPLLGLLMRRRRVAAERLAGDRPGGACRPAVEVARPELQTDGYAAILLARLAVQACRILAVEYGCVLVADPDDRARLIVVAAHGLGEDAIGERVRVDASLRAALQSGWGADAWRLLPKLGATAPAATAFLASTRDVVLWAATADQARRLDRREVELLGELAQLTGETIEDLAIKARLDSTIRLRAAELAAVRDFESGVLAHSAINAPALAHAIGSRLGLDAGALVELEIAARVSEPGIAEVPAGAAGGPDDRLGAPLLHGEPIAAAARLEHLPGFEGAALVVRFARERWDGRGLHGLPAERIPLASRILAACDALGVLTSIRPWGSGMTVETALRRLQGASGTIFDPTVIAALSSEILGEVPDFVPTGPTTDWARADAQYSAIL